MGAGKGLLSVLIGGVVGSTIAFLFAPKKGKEVREDIKDNFDSVVNKTREKSRQFFNQSMDIVDDIIKKSDELRTIIKRYKEGTYDETVEKIEREIKRLRISLLTAIETYKNSSGREDSSDDIVDRIYNEFKNESVLNKSEAT
jgi:gas vesicle protein